MRQLISLFCNAGCLVTSHRSSEVAKEGFKAVWFEQEGQRPNVLHLLQRPVKEHRMYCPRKKSKSLLTSAHRSNLIAFLLFSAIPVWSILCAVYDYLQANKRNLFLPNSAIVIVIHILPNSLWYAQRYKRTQWNALITHTRCQADEYRRTFEYQIHKYQLQLLLLVNTVSYNLCFTV